MGGFGDVDDKWQSAPLVIIVKFFRMAQMNSDGEMTKIKVVIVEIYYFALDLFIWNYLHSQNSVWRSHILKSKIFELFKLTWMGKWPKPKM